MRRLNNKNRLSDKIWNQLTHPFYIILILILFTSLLSSEIAYSANWVTERGTNTHELKIATFPYPPELSPMIRTVDGNQIHSLSTNSSFLCNIPPSNFLAQGVLINYSDCYFATTSLLVSNINENGNFIYIPPAQIGNDNWRFSYNGITGIDTINVNGQKYLVSIKHNEHQNTTAGQYQYQNRVFPQIRVENCTSGFVDGEWRHCWPSFTSYVSFGYAPINSSGKVEAERYIDVGPIVWPPNGYKDQSNNKISSGFYHPTLFVDEKYIFSYYLNDNNLQIGQRKCLSVSRVPITQFMDVNAWRNYFGGEFNTSPLPPNFDKDEMLNFYTVGGGNADCVKLPSETADAIIYMNVAKIAGTDLYIGAEESATNGADWKVGIRISRDLVNWSDMQVISTAPGAWGNGDLSYPTFVDNQGRNTNELIQPNDFYLVGKSATNSAGYELNSRRLALDLNALKQWDVNNLISNYGKSMYNDPNDDGIVNGFDFVEAIR